MKIPIKSPDVTQLLEKTFGGSPESFGKLLSLEMRPDPEGRYYHWDKLRHLKPPSRLSHEEWWCAIKLARRALYKKIPHNLDRNGKPFFYAEPDVVRRLLHRVDIHGGGEIKASKPVANPHTQDIYLINSLIEEAITSSQLEGAATTRKVAKEMLRLKRKPQNEAETMIVNNYYAMEFIREISDDDLTPKLIYQLHKILTVDTMPEAAVGKLRSSDDVHVVDERDATEIHVPPRAKELPGRVQKICDFANADSGADFLHPVIRATILHFLLAYNHPFQDGNGRTARALFYWSMLKQKYWTMDFISISRVLKKAPAQYARAYLHTETDDNDVTYFIVHQLKVITKAMDDFLVYLKRKTDEMKTVEQMLRKSSRLQGLLNYRQLALINRALKSPESVFYVKSHRGANNVTYQTARTDLLKLVDLGLLEKIRIGRAFAFNAVGDLERKLRELK